MRKISAILILITLLVSSCSMAHFDRYPGVKQDSIPSQFHGYHYLKIKQSSKDPNDSISISVHANGWSYKEGEKGETFTLNSKNVFSKVGDYYVVSMKDHHVKNYWNSWIVIPKGKKLELYPVVSNNRVSEKDKIEKYLKRVKTNLIEKGDTIYYYEMNDSSFISYFEKEIKGNKTFEIIPIKENK